MSKIQELKQKLTAPLAAIKSKIFKSKPAADGAAAPTASAPPRPGAIRKIRNAWREGETGTRLLLTVMFLTLTIGVYSLARLGIHLSARKDAIRGLFHRGTERYDKMEDFLKRQAELKHDIASMVSIDRIRINAMLDTGKSGFLAMSIYVQCDTPKTARYVEEIFPKLHDAIISKVQIVREEEMTTESGKIKLKADMKDAMNSVLGPGKIVDVFFFNLIFE